MSNNTIILKRSSVTGKKPTATQLQYGELSINYADGEIYYKSSDNTIKAVGQQYATDIASLKSGKLDANGTALKATSDASGNNIANTYIKGLSVNGKTITYTKGNGDTGTITTQDTTYGAATSSTLGLVKVGSNITNTSGTISLTKENVTSALGYTPPTTNTTYSSMTGATASADGKGGLVPTPIAGQQASYLRGDGTWAVPTNTTYSAGDGISLSGTKFSNSGVRSIASGTTANTLTVDTNGTSKTITIDNVANATKATQDSSGQTIKSTYIKGLSIDGKTITYTKGDDTTGTITTQDTTYGAATSSTLGLVKIGSNITNSSGTISLTKDNVTAALGYTPPTTNTTYSNFVGATSSANGSNGLVPAPTTSNVEQFLKGDGTWGTPTDTKYSAGAGIGLSGTTFSNSGVRSVAAGTNANQIKVNTGGTESTITVNNVANATKASTADAWTTARTITLGGDLSGSVSLDGSANVTLSAQVADDSHNHVISNVDGLQGALNAKAPLASPNLTGTPTAPTVASNTNTTQIATTEFVQSAINAKIAASDAMIYKGTIGSSGATITALPDTHTVGWTYKVITAGTYAGAKCEVGDMIVCLTSGTTANNSHWTVIQSNIDGAVVGPASSVDARVAVFSGTTGKAIKDSGYTIAASVPSGAKFTDTTYSAGAGISLSGTTFSNSGVRSVTAGTSANQIKVNTNGTDATITINNVANATSASSATKATQDSAGQQIDKTYIKGLSVDGKVITYTRGDDTTGTITTQDTTYSAATSSTLGLVKVGSNITNSSGTISLTKDNVTAALGYTPPTTNTTYSDMKGATASAAGSNGLVPAPAAGKQASFLRGDGTWVVPTNTTYSAGEGIGLSGTTFSNSGVRSITVGSTANVLSVNTGGTTTSITINNVVNATNATQLANARTIDGVSFNGTANIVHYGSCSTAAATVEKVVDCTGFTLAIGSRIIVKFTVTNTAASPTMNVNSTGAKAIYYRGAAISKGYLAANRTYEFVYNGTQYELVGDINTDTNTKVTQTLTSTAAEYSILGMADAAATATKTNGTRFSTGMTMNPSTNTITATTFKGALSGNAATATKATQDASGNTITSYYAPKASPALTGTPTAPTAAEGTNTTQIATTAFVQAAMNKVVDLSSYAKLSGATFTGAVTTPNLTVTQRAKMPVIVEYETEVTSNYTISKNSMSSHYVEIADNVTVTIEDGAIWSIGC